MNLQPLTYLALFAGFFLFLTVLGRLILGKHSSLNHTISSAMGLLFLYAFFLVLYTFQPFSLLELLSPLPFLVFAGDSVMLISFQSGAFSVLCHELLSLIILTFLINLVDTLMPAGEGVFSWLLLRLMTILGCFGLHLVVSWAFRTYLPDVLVTYAPAILLGILATMLFSGIISLVFGLIIAITNPFLGAMYSFFFSTLVGKQLSKALFTTGIVCGILYLMEHFGLVVILVSPAALLTYIPLALALLVLWFLIGHLL